MRIERRERKKKIGEGDGDKKKRLGEGHGDIKLFMLEFVIKMLERIGSVTLQNYRHNHNSLFYFFFKRY